MVSCWHGVNHSANPMHGIEKHGTGKPNARQNQCWLIPGPEVIKLFSCSTQLSMKL